MKKMHINCLNFLIEFDEAIKRIKIKNNKDFRFISFNILEQIVFSVEDNIIDNKYGLIIYNPYEISLNDKKLINNVYKEMESNIKDEYRSLIHNMELASYEVLDNLIGELDIQLEYEPDIDIVKLFNAFNVSFPAIDNTNYLELIVEYFKLNARYSKTKFIVSFGLTSLLDVEELVLLEKELSYNDLVLLDIEHNDEKIIANDLIIEEEWCII